MLSITGAASLAGAEGPGLGNPKSAEGCSFFSDGLENCGLAELVDVLETKMKKLEHLR